MEETWQCNDSYYSLREFSKKTLDYAAVAVLDNNDAVFTVIFRTLILDTSNNDVTGAFAVVRIAPVDLIASMKTMLPI